MMNNQLNLKRHGNKEKDGQCEIFSALDIIVED